MDKEKLLLIKEIIKFAEGNYIHCTGDIISKLYNEEKETLELLTQKGLPFFLQNACCEFVLEKEADPAIKKQIIKKLMNMQKAIPDEMSKESYQKYIFSLADFYQLVESETELSRFIEEVNSNNHSQYYVANFIASLSMLKDYGLTAKECINFMNTIYMKNNIDLIKELSKVIDGYCESLKENKVSYQEVLSNLAIVLKSGNTIDILNWLVLNNKYTPLDITNEEMKVFLQEMGKRPPFLIGEILNLVKREVFIEAVNTKKIDFSRFLEYIHGQDSSLSLSLSLSLIVYHTEHLQKGEKANDLFEISQEIADVLEPKTYVEKLRYIQFIESRNFQNLINKDREDIKNLIHYLASLPENRAYSLISALKNGSLIEVKKDNQEIIDYLKQFEKLDENTLFKFVGYMSSSYQECPEKLFTTLSYLIEKMNSQPTPLEQNKLETALKTINPVINKTKAEKTDTINKQVVDIIFDTDKNEQLETICEVAKEFYPEDLNPNTYLLMIWYMSKCKLRDKAEISFLRYRDEIIRINEMLDKIDQEEQKVEKVMLKK